MILYKYYPCNEYTFRALSEMGLWCSPASNMNDPFDCLGQLDTKFDELERTSLVTRLTDFMVGFKTSKIQEQIVDEVREYVRSFAKINLDDQDVSTLINKMCSSPNILVDNLINKISRHRDSIIKEFCFCSLSKEYTDIQMWSHYANSHRGVVIGIEFEDSYINSNRLVHEVHYTNKLPPFDIIEYSKVESSDDPKLMFIMLKYLSHKTLNWKYEKEYRIWYRNQPSYFKYDQSQLKSVYFGYKCPEETKTLVKSILRGHGVSDSIYHNIRIETDPEIRLVI